LSGKIVKVCAMRDARQQLADSIIRKAFEPVLDVKADGRSEAGRKSLESVQDATPAEIERYRHDDTAQAVLTNFRRDLSSEAARNVRAWLRHLYLPTIEDVEDEVKDRAHQLGIGSSS
jgi:hypothetical protein